MDLQRQLLGIMGNSSCMSCRPSLIRVFGFCLGHGCWVGVTVIASGLLNFRRSFALRLEGNKSQVGVIPICVSFEGRIMPCCTIFTTAYCLRLLVLAGMHPRHAPVYLAGSLL
jgi:uncharacterized SAM-binding protein YcdF (DUF218 family)